MKEIAIYGKGGIGKSTLSANISAALAGRGKQVLQIGCDPKHDSTRLLMGGHRITTVLDYIRHTGVADYRLEDILYTGYRGIGCIEAGGPEPGVGCAGRGIITAFELLDRFHVKQQYDLVLYDVLGDVVCGGFAVPIRREYADTIFIVTSGEYMSIYAANNILRGIQNYDQDRCRVAGILYNSRNVKDEDQRVLSFAHAVDLPIFSKIPRDDAFASAEKEGCTVTELLEGQDASLPRIFTSIADRILLGPELHAAKPLTDEDLEELIFYGKKQNQSPPSHKEQSVRAAVYDSGVLSKDLLRDKPLEGCAFNGAMNTAVHLTDAAIIAHSPKSCTYIAYQNITSAGRRQVYERGSLTPAALVPNLVSTNMDETDMVFGGMEKLLDTVNQVKKGNPSAIIIISACPAGIIGDDINKARALSTPDCPIITIKTDGNLSGDYMQGMLMTYTQLAEQAIDPQVEIVPGRVNIIYEKVIAKNTAANFSTISSLLRELGLTIGCRFLCNTSYESLKNFCSAELNLMAYNDYAGQVLQKFFCDRYNSRFYSLPLPVGYSETCRWLRGLGVYFGKELKAESIISRYRAAYENRVRELRPVLCGKRLMIITINHELDWIIEAARDVGLEIVKIGVLDYSQDEGFRSQLSDAKDLPVELHYDRDKGRDRDVATLKPDILLSNYEASREGETCLLDTIPMCPDCGFYSGLALIERWRHLFIMNERGGWEHDRFLFDKYYTR